MEKIPAKQIDGVVDLVTEQQVTARKQFDDGVGASNGTSTHYPILKGGYLYWVVSPGGNPQNGDYRLGVGSSGILAFEIRQSNAWAPYCPPNCVAAPSGCLLHGTQILMADGSNKAVEDIQVGDLVTSVALTGLDSQNENGWQTYQTSFFGPSPNTASVVGVLNAQFNAYYIINNKLHITFEHPVLIKRNQQYQFSRVQDLVIGDELFHFVNGWTPLDTFELVNETVNVVNIHVETQDTYFADHLLVYSLSDPMGAKSSN
jgi:hypothetical protein